MTGGTMARLAAEGHRVVLITATDGAAGLTASTTISTRTLASVRREELQRSITALGVARLVLLGYADSGLDGNGTPSTAGLDRQSGVPFTHVATKAAASKVAAILEEETADVLVGYDAAGGYGHPDHKQVHRVARLAAQMTPAVMLLEATLPREPLARAVTGAHHLRRIIPALGGLDPATWSVAHTPRADITHRVNVRRFADVKRAAIAAHASQQAADRDVRTLEVLLRLPRPAFRLLLGWEWYVGPRSARTRYVTHPLAKTAKS